jgi:hypothetical protein
VSLDGGIAISGDAGGGERRTDGFNVAQRLSGIRYLRVRETGLRQRDAGHARAMKSGVKRTAGAGRGVGTAHGYRNAAGWRDRLSTRIADGRQAGETASGTNF